MALNQFHQSSLIRFNSLTVRGRRDGAWWAVICDLSVEALRLSAPASPPPPRYLLSVMHFVCNVIKAPGKSFEAASEFTARFKGKWIHRTHVRSGGDLLPFSQCVRENGYWLFHIVGVLCSLLKVKSAGGSHLFWMCPRLLFWCFIFIILWYVWVCVGTWFRDLIWVFSFFAKQ